LTKDTIILSLDENAVTIRIFFVKAFLPILVCTYVVNRLIKY